MIRHSDIDNKTLSNMIKQDVILYGGNIRLKIYGTLHCRSGKRMKRENRVFFKSSSEAEAKGYRACKHCMKRDNQ